MQAYSQDFQLDFIKHNQKNLLKQQESFPLPQEIEFSEYENPFIEGYDARVQVQDSQKNINKRAKLSEVELSKKNNISKNVITKNFIHKDISVGSLRDSRSLNSGEQNELPFRPNKIFKIFRNNITSSDRVSLDGEKHLQYKKRWSFKQIDSLTHNVNMNIASHASNTMAQEFQKEESKRDFIHCVPINILLNTSSLNGTQLKYRKDVINKKIFRAFKKFIARCFYSTDCKPSKLKVPFGDFKQTLLEDAERIGLYHPEDASENTEEFRELVCWLAMNKYTKITKSLFNYNNDSIRILSTILVKYSHSSLENLIKNKKIGRAFKFFTENGLNSFITSLPKASREIYSKTVSLIAECFNYNC
ncbi:unnamed protein product [Moneuplotes crassus]|uniref:Uncharacterized protein n=1 Tax=Euplotes crassus TaxID=5936 RepID=A0AAD1Y6Q6_EUPCR|nr:unnamed protein product [Moneuplotes crassus]